MSIQIRRGNKEDVEELIALSLLAWAPVFASFRQVLGPTIYHRLVGFIVYELKYQEMTGEVHLLAVHPEYQNQGIGTELNNFALARMKESGMQLAEVGTGGDPGHAPARQSYEKAGYSPMPLVRYYKAL